MLVCLLFSMRFHNLKKSPVFTRTAKHCKSRESSSKISSTQGGVAALVRVAEGPSEPRCGEEIKTERRRFSNFPCPVRIHHVSFVLNHLECAQLYRSTPFADSCAPSVHQIAFQKRAPSSSTTDYFRDSRNPSMLETKRGHHFP